MTSILGDDLTRDAFLGGRVHAVQPRRGYRAGVDPVLLAAACPATSGETVLELGCGVGVAALCLAWRSGAHVTGLEMQPDYAALAQRNAVPLFQVLEGDLRDMPTELRAASFDHVIANPPYFDRRHSTRAADSGRETALGEEASLAEWVDAAIRRLKPKGWLTMIHRADRLPDILATLDTRMGAIAVLPVAPRQGRTAELVIVRTRKSARTPFKLLPPLVMHIGAEHTKDGDDYTPKAAAVLREGASLADYFHAHT